MIKDHGKVTGFSGNEIFCLNKIGLKPGQLCLGNSVISMGMLKGIGAGLSNLAGGEIAQITQLVHDGRSKAYDRMIAEARHYGGRGLAGVSFDLINHGTNLEFLAMGSTVRNEQEEQKIGFSTSANAQELFCQIDAGFKPHSMVFGNVAYSIGVGGNIKGALRGLKRGEVTEYTEIFDRTRHLALTRIKKEAIRAKANAVIGIRTSIAPLLGTQEMVMIGTASSHPLLDEYANDPVTSDMTNEELWNMVNLGYMPISLVIGVSVYSLGFVGGLASIARSVAGGEIAGLTEILYEAREKALARIQENAEKSGADEIIGVKTRVYDLGGGLVEFMVMGTAVKKIEGAKTVSENIPPQAFIQDRETFVDVTQEASTVNLSSASKAASASKTQRGPISFIVSAIFIIFYIFMKLHHG
jgi:uncharacterized protein YbjQ (UPF0145 family)